MFCKQYIYQIIKQVFANFKNKSINKASFLTERYEIRNQYHRENKKRKHMGIKQYTPKSKKTNESKKNKREIFKKDHKPNEN